MCRCCQCPYIPPDRYALAADRNRNGEGGREAELIGKKSAELILANGQRIDLEKQIVELREENGIHISNSTLSYLAYRQDTLTYTDDSYEELVYNTVKIPAGADYKIYLADGSEVWLN